MHVQSLITDIRKFGFIRHLSFSVLDKASFSEYLGGSGEEGGFTCKFDI